MNGEYCIYLRKSRSDENNPNVSMEETLARHEKTLLTLSKQMNLNITKIYREVVSGDTIASRPVVQELLADVESGIWSGVLVMEVERLARGDTIDQGIISQTFKYSDTKIITPIKTYNPNDEYDEEYFEFGLFMSRREYKVINRRLQRGREASVKEGNYLGSVPPYGYKRVPNQDGKGYTLEINKDEAETVKLIYEMYTNGIPNDIGVCERIGISKIAKKLSQMGINPRKSKTWSIATIKDILKNPVYIGKTRWGNRKAIKKIVNGKKITMRPRAKDFILEDGKHPAIITEDVFNTAQYYMSKNPAKPIGENRKITNPLAGLVVCSKCNHKMIARPYSNNTPTSLLCTTLGCQTVGTALHYVEDRIIEALYNWLNKYTLNIKPCNTIQNSSYEKLMLNNLNAIQDEIITLNKQMDSLYDFLELGVYTTEIFIERSKKISDKMSELKENEDNIKNELSKSKKQTAINKDFIPKLKNILDTYYEISDPEIKNQMLKEVVEKVVYTKEKRGTKKTPDKFEITIYPKLPNTQILSLPK